LLVCLLVLLISNTYSRHVCHFKYYSGDEIMEEDVNKWRTSGGRFGVLTSNPEFWSFDKAEPNSQFGGKCIRNNLIRIRVSLICKIEQNPWLGGLYLPQIPVLSALCPQLNLLETPPPSSPLKKSLSLGMPPIWMGMWCVMKRSEIVQGCGGLTM
jgi:hypothetical protein